MLLMVSLKYEKNSEKTRQAIAPPDDCMAVRTDARSVANRRQKNDLLMSGSPPIQIQPTRLRFGR